MQFTDVVWDYISTGMFEFENNTKETYKVDGFGERSIRRAVLKCRIPEYDWVRVYITDFGGQVIKSTNMQMG